MKLISDAKTRITSIISSLASVLGIGSSGTSVACQTTCSATSGVLPVLGISLAATPFAFLTRYQTPIWWVALSLFVLAFGSYLSKNAHTKFEEGLLFINGGLLLIGIPYFRSSQLSTVLTLLGIAIFIIGTYFLATAKKFIIKFTDSYNA